jgi:hypothetical protein
MGGGRARTLRLPGGALLPSPRPAPDNMEGWGWSEELEARAGSISTSAAPTNPYPD